MTVGKGIVLIFLGFSSGVVISGAVFAFIAMIGVVPRLAQKTGTREYIPYYEDALVVGGVFGATTRLIPYHISIGLPAVLLFSLCIGIFYGCLAISLAEILDVVPILTRRIRVQRGMFWFMLALALGKLAGSMIYYRIPGFFSADG